MEAKSSMPSARPLRLLFVKDSLAWPRSSGHDVHCFHMMRALADLGHAVSLATVRPVTAQAVEGVKLQRCERLPQPAATDNGDGLEDLGLSRLQQRFRSYWGIDQGHIRAVAQLAEATQADAVIAVGLEVLPYLAAVRGALRVWYAADEWLWHHLSQVRLTRPATWDNLKAGLIKGLYERAYAPRLDRVWVVSEADRRAMRWVAGTRGLDVLPNGIDGEHYRPVEQAQTEQSCVFWGRLDFGPNIQALEWFCGRVWPKIRSKAPDARFTIYGFQPTETVQVLAGRDNISLVPDLPDLRAEIARQQVVVLPFVSGGGIKNKLLEAASMGKAIVCTPRACGGLRLPADAPLRVARSAEQWVRELLSLWSEPERRRQLSAAARRWVLEHHSWRASAQTAVAGLQSVQPARRGR
jgi:glycosyltransferase involved in cell wall biosynthesis